MTMRKAAGFVAAAILAFCYGLYSGHTQDPVFVALGHVKRAFTGKEPPRFNALGQLARYPGKTPVPCPAQTARTMVAVVFGQSNAGNRIGQRHAGRPNVVSFYEGECYAAVDPLLGASGDQGSQWVLTANLLADKYDAIVLVPAAVGGTRVAQWADGLIAEMFDSRLRVLKARYTATHFLWHQGEADLTTDPSSYRSDLLRVIDRTREHFPDRRFFVAIATYCEGESEAIRQAQRSVVNGRDILAGANTDTMTALEDRADDCHMSGVAQAKAAQQWRAAITAAR